MDIFQFIHFKTHLNVSKNKEAIKYNLKFNKIEQQTTLNRRQSRNIPCSFFIVRNHHGGFRLVDGEDGCLITCAEIQFGV